MLKKLLPLALALLLLAACTSAPSPATTPPTDEVSSAPTGGTPETQPGYTFEAKGVAIRMGQPADQYVTALGDPTDKFEAPSCAFEGIDRIYYYSGFELYTFPKDGVDYVLSVSLTDDSVTTDKGIYLGCTLDDVTAAYTTNYTQNAEEYTYLLGDTKLSFILENGVVASITYRFAEV